MGNFYYLTNKMSRRSCMCKKKVPYVNLYRKGESFEQIEWLKKRVPQEQLINRIVKLKYLIHPAQMNEHLAIKKVFNRFDDDGNSNAYK